MAHKWQRASHTRLRAGPLSCFRVTTVWFIGDHDTKTTNISQAARCGILQPMLHGPPSSHHPLFGRPSTAHGMSLYGKHSDKLKIQKVQQMLLHKLSAYTVFTRVLIWIRNKSATIFSIMSQMTPDLRESKYKGPGLALRGRESNVVRCFTIIKNAFDNICKSHRSTTLMATAACDCCVYSISSIVTSYVGQFVEQVSQAMFSIEIKTASIRQLDEKTMAVVACDYGVVQVNEAVIDHFSPPPPPHTFDLKAISKHKIPDTRPISVIFCVRLTRENVQRFGGTELMPFDWYVGCVCEQDQSTFLLARFNNNDSWFFFSRWCSFLTFHFIPAIHEYKLLRL